MFTKMNLWWSYNNVCIKEGDKWKVVFIIHMRSSEPVVMFFGITNLSVIFQGIMNKIMWNLINEGKVTVFVDNVLVGTDDKKEHDKTMAEVLKQLKENDLYMKPEKYL